MREILRIFYELSNHLGNVLATVSDRKLASSSDGTNVDYYDADVTSTTDYYPYGMTLRSESDGGNYRYGFQGQEMDDEVKGEGNSVNYKYRMHDPRIGRFFAVDPLARKYAHLSVYQFSSNSPIFAIELEGLESAADYELFVKVMAEGTNEDKIKIQGWMHAMYSIDKQNTQALGALQMVGGFFEALGGVALTEGTVGLAAVPGAAVVAHGADNMQAGFFTMINGEVTHTLTSQAMKAGLEGMGVDPETAAAVAMYVDLGFSLTGGIAGANKILSNAGKLPTISSGAGFIKNRFSKYKTRGPGRALGNADEGILMNEGKQTRIGGDGTFTSVELGEAGTANGRYLWTIDESGLNIASENTAIGANSQIKHTNLSNKAYGGGEVWFTGQKTIHINAWSGRFGKSSGMTLEMYNSAIKSWENLGYKVTAESF
ncbi:MAG: hypothetical protein GQ574_10820 [Crocinitomix sp.]|nr:hypothetical protein [Crocinitomix sp.]